MQVARQHATGWSGIYRGVLARIGVSPRIENPERNF